MKNLEWQFNEGVLLTGDLKSEDASFAHDFGIRHAVEHFVENFEVHTFLNGQWEPIVLKHNNVSEKLRERFLEWALLQRN